MPASSNTIPDVCAVSWGWHRSQLSYAGVGSRETPSDVMELMCHCAGRLERCGYILRSGGADGADTAFESGVRECCAKLILLPWRGFNGRRDESYCIWQYGPDHAKLARYFHPNWWACSSGAKMLHTRNVAQVLGLDCTVPAVFVLCWTKDGRDSGGTGQALRIARSYGVVVYNLHDPRVREAFEEFATGGRRPYALEEEERTERFRLEFLAEGR